MKYLLLFLILLPIITHAQGFVPLVGVPGVDPNGGGGIGEYVQALYILAISVAAFLAVVKIIFSGVQYLMSDVVTSKEDAKKGIKGALLGLLIVLAAVIILETINPQLTNLDVLRNANITVDSSAGGVFDLSRSGPGFTVDDIVNDPNDNRFGTTPTITDCDTGGITCAEATTNCMNNPNYNSVQQTGPNSVTCFLNN